MRAMRQPGGHVRSRWSGPVLSAVFRGDDDDRAARVVADLGADRPHQQPGERARAAGSNEHQRELAAAIPNARLHIIERAGHNPYAEQPAEVMQAVRDFISA